MDPSTCQTYFWARTTLEQHTLYASRCSHISFTPDQFSHISSNQCLWIVIQVKVLAYILLTNLFIHISQTDPVPEIAGVNIPSPMSIEVPTSTKITSILWLQRDSSSHFLTFLAIELLSDWIKLYVVNAWSVGCWFGMVFVLACRQINE